MATPAKTRRTTPLPKTSNAGADSKGGEVKFRGIPEELRNITLLVEGRELPVNRAALAIYSPVFQKMFYSNFKERKLLRVPLPDEHYGGMVMFLNVLFRTTTTSEERITDGNLLQLLSLADKYDTEQVKVRCQDYIGDQLADYFFNFYNHYTHIIRVMRVPASGINPPISKGDISGQRLTKPQLLDKLSLYMRACDRHRLRKYSTKVKSLIVAICQEKKDLCGAKHYGSLSSNMKVELLEAILDKK